MNIRPIQEADEAAVAALWRTVFPSAPIWNHPESDIRRKLLTQRELFIVAELENTIVGTAMGGFDGHRGWVYYVAVLPEFRRRNIGRVLMERVEHDLIAFGCTKINIQVRNTNKGVVEFYRRIGYLIEDHVSMGKLLNKS
jgi:ribosomal protein S18 acetylase RimI-like enzyme